MEFDIHFIPHFHEQSDVVIGSKASIQTKTGFDGLRVFGIIAFQLFEPLT